jgi:hypothetical protein
MQIATQGIENLFTTMVLGKKNVDLKTHLSIPLYLGISY